MKLKYAFFPNAGLQRVLKNTFAERYRAIYIGEDESLLICNTNLPPKEVSKLPFLSFLVMSQKKFPPSTPLREIVDALINPNILEGFQKNINPRHHSFRFMVSKEGRLVAIDPKLRIKIENQIRQAFNLRHNPHKADAEFWIVIRRGGLSFFGLRLRGGEKREKGELSAAVAYLLNAFSQPKPEDVFLDPFAGTGAIALSRAKYFPAQQIIASDNNPQLLNRLKQRLGGYPNTHISPANALNMKEIPDHSVDVIVTDPPWGEYQPLPSSPFEFYKRMLREFKRVIKENGRIVVLIGRAQEEDFERATQATELSPTQKLNILVAGRKANIYLFNFKSSN